MSNNNLVCEVLKFMSKSQLAVRLGRSEQTIYRWQRGIGYPKGAEVDVIKDIIKKGKKVEMEIRY